MRESGIQKFHYLGVTPHVIFMKIKNYFDKPRLLIVLVVAILYGNILRNGYALDDSIVTEPTNITAKGLAAIPKIVHSYYIERANDVKFEYRPLVKISFAIEHELFGVNVTVSHFVNLLLYLIILLLAYRILLLLFKDTEQPVALYSTLLFAMMPVHTEVVASLKNREELLSFLFCLIALWQFLKFFDSDFRHWLSLLMTLLSFYLAFLAKLDALPFLAVAPVLAYSRQRLYAKQAFLFGGLLFGTLVLYQFTKHGLLEKTTAKRLSSYFENPLFFTSEWKYRVIALFNSLGFYISQCLFPFKQSCYYGYDTLPVFRLSWQGVLGIISVPVLAFGLIRSYIKKDFPLFAGLFIFCAAISMYLNLARPAVGIVAERFAFAASLGAAISIAALFCRYLSLKPAASRQLKIAAVFLSVIFGGMVISRNRDWKNLDTLILTDQPKYPNSAFLNYRAGLAIIQSIEQKRTRIESMEQQRQLFIKARDLVQHSVNVDRSYVPSRQYLCYINIYLLNDFKAALPQVDTALSIEQNTELYFYKAICMRETKQPDSAEFYLKKCIQLDVAYNNAYNLLAYDYAAAKQFDKTVVLYTNAIKAGVNTLEINNGLGKTYWQMGDTANAIVYYQHALELSPTNEEASAMLKRLRKK